MGSRFGLLALCFGLLCLASAAQAVELERVPITLPATMVDVEDASGFTSTVGKMYGLSRARDLNDDLFFALVSIDFATNGTFEVIGQYRATDPFFTLATWVTGAALDSERGIYYFVAYYYTPRWVNPDEQPTVYSEGNSKLYAMDINTGELLLTHYSTRHLTVWDIDVAADGSVHYLGCNHYQSTICTVSWMAVTFEYSGDGLTVVRDEPVSRSFGTVRNGQLGGQVALSQQGDQFSMQIGGAYVAPLTTTVLSTSFVQVLNWAGPSDALKFGLAHSNATGISYVAEGSFLTEELHIKQTGYSPEDFVTVCTVDPYVGVWSIGFDSPLSIDPAANVIMVLSSAFGTLDDSIQKSGGMLIDLDTCETAHWYLPGEVYVTVSDMIFFNGS